MRRWKPPDPTFTKDWKEWARSLKIDLPTVECECAFLGSVTLDNGATTTVVTDLTIATTSVVLLTPTSAAAAPVAYWVATAAGSFTINHAAGLVGATFSFVVFN